MSWKKSTDTRMTNKFIDTMDDATQVRNNLTKCGGELPTCWSMALCWWLFSVLLWVILWKTSGKRPEIFSRLHSPLYWDLMSVLLNRKSWLLSLKMSSAEKIERTLQYPIFLVELRSLCVYLMKPALELSFPRFNRYSCCMDQISSLWTMDSQGRISMKRYVLLMKNQEKKIYSECYRYKYRSLKPSA